jgi:hypothetical protein
MYINYELRGYFTLKFRIIPRFCITLNVRLSVRCGVSKSINLNWRDYYALLTFLHCILISLRCITHAYRSVLEISLRQASWVPPLFIAATLLIVFVINSWLYCKISWFWMTDRNFSWGSSEVSWFNFNLISNERGSLLLYTLTWWRTDILLWREKVCPIRSGLLCVGANRIHWFTDILRDLTHDSLRSFRTGSLFCLRSIPSSCNYL